MTVLVDSSGGRRTTSRRYGMSVLILTAGVALAGCQKSDSLPSSRCTRSRAKCCLPTASPWTAAGSILCPRATCP